MSGRGYETVIGLEIHVELSTATKMFCGCPNEFGNEPNTQTCPVCLGLPGSLPVINERAVEFAIKIGLALNSEIAERCIFHRKNYFYPDMPKNYQISQYDEPICVGGFIEIPLAADAPESGSGKGGTGNGSNGKGGSGDGGTAARRVRMVRAHLEEDTGKSTHVGGGGRIHDAAHSLEDYNRAGVPLAEIVSEPDIRSPAEARAFAQELRQILLTLGVSDVKMEEGSMRVDANISTRPAGHPEYGTKVEIKNMNSLRSLQRALEYEEERQRGLLETGKPIVQETRHWNEEDGRTHSMRSKEEAFDYRYFPEPDLQTLAPSRDWVEELRASLPELPAALRKRLADEYGLSAQQVAVLSTAEGLAPLVTGAATLGADPVAAANFATGDVLAHMNANGTPLDETGLDAAKLAGLCALVTDGTLSSKLAKEVLAETLATGKEPAAVVEERGLVQVSDEGELGGIVDEIIAASPGEAERFRAGEEKLLGYFVGQVMKATGGKANPKAANEIVRQKLSG